MIEDKKLGLKMAENEEEAAWELIRENTEKSIQREKIELELNKVVLEYVERKQKSLNSKGSKK